MTETDELTEIIAAYDTLVLGISQTAKQTEGRAYGGIVRAGKGELTENIAKHLIELAWKRLNKSDSLISIVKKRELIKIRPEYLAKLKNDVIKEFIRKNIQNYVYPLKVDWTIFVKNNAVLEVECKAYTENAMLKRVLVDSTLLKTIHPKIKSVLFQLESQLGGDYSELKPITFGGNSTHTLLSYFDVDLTIITLLEGERDVYKPIHDKKYFKPLKIESLEKAVSTFEGLLKEFA